MEYQPNPLTCFVKNHWDNMRCWHEGLNGHISRLKITDHILSCFFLVQVCFIHSIKRESRSSSWYYPLRNSENAYPTSFSSIVSKSPLIDLLAVIALVVSTLSAWRVLNPSDLSCVSALTADHVGACHNRCCGWKRLCQLA